MDKAGFLNQLRIVANNIRGTEPSAALSLERLYQEADRLIPEPVVNARGMGKQEALRRVENYAGSMGIPIYTARTGNTPTPSQAILPLEEPKKGLLQEIADDKEAEEAPWMDKAQEVIKQVVP